MRVSMKLFSVVLLWQCVVVAASTSCVSIANEKTLNNEKTTVNDIIDNASVNEPVIVIQFSKYKILENLVDENYRYSYLNKFFKKSVTNVFIDDTKRHDRHHHHDTIVFNLKTLENDPFELLHDSEFENKKIIWFEFHSKDYNLSELDQYLETIVVYLSEYLSKDIDIIINSKDTLTLEDINQDISDNNDSYYTENDNINDENDNDTEDEDDDSLSPIWTEGLLMCLLVSFILLIILIIAISWISSIDISYGALEKSTNPLKKNQ